MPALQNCGRVAHAGVAKESNQIDGTAHGSGYMKPTGDAPRLLPHVSAPIEVKPMWQRSGGLALVCDKCLNVRFPEDFPEHAGDERLKLR